MTHPHTAVTGPTVRAWITYWRADAIRQVVTGAGWVDVEVTRQPGTQNNESWLEVHAARA